MPGEPRRFGACDFEVQKGVAEPVAHIRGEIACIHAYMSATDRLRLAPRTSEMLAQWSFEHPPTRAERALWNESSDVLGSARRWHAPSAPLGPVVRRSP